MKLVDEIERVSGYLNATTGVAPSSEMDTCHWVIYPLLLSIGYHHHDIFANLANSAGQFPDYTILPNSPHTWYLEAKSWNVALQDSHVIQAINYAHTTGKRWVVLSNGREWRLYDDHIQGVEAGKRLVCTAKLEDKGQVEQFLCALGKTSVMTGHLTKFVSRTRLNAILESQLTNPSSDIIKTLTSTLKNTYGLADVQKTDLCEFFADSLKTALPVSSAEPANPPSASRKTLAELIHAGPVIHHIVPQRLICPDDSQKQVKNWRDVVEGVIVWLAQCNLLPAPPFSGQGKGKRYLYNSTPHHANGEAMQHYRTLQVNGTNIYLHVNRSAQDFLYCLGALCKQSGQATDSFTVYCEHSH